MSVVYGLIGFTAGFFFGVGAMLFYVRWRMKKQLGSLEEQMGAITELSEEMSDMMDPENMDMDLDDPEDLEIEDAIDEEERENES